MDKRRFRSSRARHRVFLFLRTTRQPFTFYPSPSTLYFLSFTFYPSPPARAVPSPENTDHKCDHTCAGHLRGPRALRSGAGRGHRAAPRPNRGEPKHHIDGGSSIFDTFPPLRPPIAMVIPGRPGGAGERPPRLHERPFPPHFTRASRRAPPGPAAAPSPPLTSRV